MAIYSLNHKYISKKTHPPRVASDHLRYVLRKSACSQVIAANMPTPEIGTRGGKTKAWLEKHEDNARKNGRVIDKIMLALPIELTVDQRVELIKDFVADITGGEETYWLAAMHDQDSPNPHSHLIFVDKGVHTGKRVIEFSERNSTQRLRERWAAITNAYFKRHGIDAEIDHRSLSKQREEMMLRAEWAVDEAERAAFEEAAEKLNRKPSGHDGPELQAYEAKTKAKGETSDKLDRLRNLRVDLTKDETDQKRPATTKAYLEQLLTQLHAPADETHRHAPEAEFDARWDDGNGRRSKRTGLVTVLATLNPEAGMRDLHKMAGQLLQNIKSDPRHPLRRYTAQIELLGHATRNGNWRKIEALKNTFVTLCEAHAQSEAKEALESPPSPERDAIEDVDGINAQSPPDTAQEATTDAQQGSERLSHAEDASQPSEPLPETPQELIDTAKPLQDPLAPSQSAAEARRARQEAKAEEKARKAAEKAAVRQRAEFEEPVTESRKRVLRVRTPINVVKGTFENLKAGRDMLEPYPQSKLRRTTDKFLAAATRLLNSWDAYLTDRSRRTDFTTLEEDYLKISAELTEMHLVVPKPKAMAGADLIDEQARLQELEDFPDQSLIKPVMTGIKKRLKQVIAYLTNTDDGRAKAEQVAAIKRAEEAEAQRSREREEYLAARRRQEKERQSRLSTAKKVRAIVDRALEEPEIYDIVASYGFKAGQDVDEIANHPSWRSVAPGSSSVAWYDLEQRVKQYDQDQQDAADQHELKQIGETLGGLLDRANQQNDTKLDELLKPLCITRFTDRDGILKNPTWLQAVRGDDQKRPLWEAVHDRLAELDAIEERIRVQRAEAERLRD